MQPPENALSTIHYSPLTTPSGEPPRTQISLAEIRVVIRKRKWVIVTCLAVMLALATAYCIKAPRRYEATVRVVVNPDSSNPLGIAMGDAMNPFMDSSLMQETQVKIMQSDTVAWDVIRQLRLDQRKEFASEKPVLQSDSLDMVSAERRFELLELFHRRLKVASVPKTALVELHYRSKDPKLAADIVNATASAYLERNFRAHYNANMQVSDWLTKQLDDLKKKVESSQQRVVDFQKQNGIIGTDETHNIVISQLDEMNKQLAGAQAERIVREARYRQALSDDPEVVAEIAPSATLQLLRSQQLDLKDQYAQLSETYGKNYPRLEQLRAQLLQTESAVQKEVVNTRRRLEAEYQAATKGEKLATDEVEIIKQQAYKLNEAGIQYLILKREGDASRDLYEDLMKKLNEAGIIAGLNSTNVNVVDGAEIPVLPAEPMVGLSLLIALALGSVGGVGLAFVLESLDTTISSSQQAESLAKMPVLSVVPHILLRGRNGTRPLEKFERDKPLALVRPQSTFTEAFRALRTALLLSTPGSAPKVLLVTSSVPMEGKTTTAINLAVVLAQSKLRVLLVDADMRNSAVHDRLGIVRSDGLSRCLTGESNFADVVIPLPELPNLHFLSAGLPPPSPAELLGSDQMRLLIERWRKEYDHVVLDTPPVMGLTDAVVLATMCDAVLMVVRCSRTGRQTLRRAREILARVNARMVGIVVNDLRIDSPEGYDYYGYGYGYYGDKTPKDQDRV
jgi:capsular exopolysaccharide synthesis family protein